MLRTKELYKEPCICSTCMEYVEEYDGGVDDREPTLEGVNVYYHDGNGTKVGRCYVEMRGHDEKKASVWSVRVHDDYRRMGHGSKMMVETMDMLDDMGYEQVSLQCDGGIAARKAYERAGFVTDDDFGRMVWHRGGA